MSTKRAVAVCTHRELICAALQETGLDLPKSDLAETMHIMAGQNHIRRPRGPLGHGFPTLEIIELYGNLKYICHTVCTAAATNTSKYNRNS